ncbi:PLC-like phosphodiesterase [Leucosporidium creatinivorum]|uniref:PLC-like phosphodiesterase n=1 Tax=Leucosporidium creatinivorum TaxID=106004 RepID=A0A1Y2G2I2_9BASI|nr:PLC-like phosphodiesterase [Leucosporidium creatinivorum]
MVLSLFKTALVAALAFSTGAAAAACNGHEEYCTRTYSNVSVIGAHNSYGVSAGSIAANQNYTVETQLDNGIRLLQVQAHMSNNEIHLCHTSCLLLDAGTFTSYLTTVKTWLDANPNEVITILIVNSDGIDPATIAASYASAGMDTYAYTPSSVPIAKGDWPTLQTLIDAGTRVVNFLAQNADVSTAPYLIDEFTNVWETPYDETDDSFPCTVDRGASGYQDKMYLVNHYLDVNVTLLGQTIPIPATSELSQTNAATGITSLGEQADTCYAAHQYYPTFTLVDFYDVGNGSVFEYAATLNGVTYEATTIGNGSTTSTSSSGNGSVSSSDLSGASSLLSQLLGSQVSLVLALVASVGAVAV